METINNFPSQEDYKCFACSNDDRFLYPIMVSYFNKESLIPFCPEMFQCKLIDLGNAVRKQVRSHSTIQTRPYRAPEVLLNCEYDEKSDIFSAGCTIFELLTGYFLF